MLLFYLQNHIILFYKKSNHIVFKISNEKNIFFIFFSHIKKYYLQLILYSKFRLFQMFYGSIMFYNLI